MLVAHWSYDMTDYSIASLFSRLDTWRHFPAYQLERRADIFFGLYLTDALNHHLRSRRIAINPRIIPEFPLGQTKTKRSDKADYFALSTDRMHAFLIELKTDLRSRRDTQDKYLEQASTRGMAELLCEVKSMAKTRNRPTRKKYFHLLRALADLGLMKLPSELERKVYDRSYAPGVYDCIEAIKFAPVLPTLEVIYILPTPRDNLDCIDFGTLAGIVEHQGEIGGQFAHCLRRWAGIEAGSEPPNRHSGA